MSISFISKAEAKQIAKAKGKGKAKDGFVSNTTLRELLVYAASQGALSGLKVPDWATGGTDFEKVLEALQILGRGTWLEDFGGYGDGMPTDGDSWFRKYCMGHEVPTPDDDPGDSDDSDDS